MVRCKWEHDGNLSQKRLIGTADTNKEMEEEKMYNYYVIEIQTNATGAPGMLVTGFPDKLTSEDAFLQARAGANDSTVACHTVMWVTKEGKHVEQPACYHHAEPAPEEQEPAT